MVGRGKAGNVLNDFSLVLAYDAPLANMGANSQMAPITSPPINSSAPKAQAILSHENRRVEIR
jgi:hypothetical protein